MDPNQLQPFLPLVTGFLGGATSAGVFAGPIQTVVCQLWPRHF